MRLAVQLMDLDDVGQVLEVDRESYSLPWPPSAYRREIMHNRNARYYVLREQAEAAALHQSISSTEHRGRLQIPFLRWSVKPAESRRNQTGRILGYAGMWMMVDEAHITTIAMRTELRGRGLGELLLASLIAAAMELGAERVTLEVRVSNTNAQNLYRKYGFHERGVRPRYYSDNNEDAYIMTTDNIQASTYRELFESLADMLQQRLQRAELVLLDGPLALERAKSRPVHEAD